MREVHPSLDSSLTEWEWLGLTKRYNLADAHVHHGLRPDQAQVAGRALEFFVLAQVETMQQHQRRFLDAFFSFAGQAISEDAGFSPVLHYSSSVSIDVAAKTLAAMRRRRVALVSPTFDNIPRLLRRNGLDLMAVEDQAAWSDTNYLDERLREVDALFLVAPNNPTGAEPTRQEFEAVVEACMRHGCTLAVDFSFRFFSDLRRWDQYAVVDEAADLDYLFIEDTGKTWPTAELKTGILSSSKRVMPVAQLVSDELLLGVSPVTLQLLEQLIKLDLEQASPDQPLTPAGALVRDNRHELRVALKEGPVEIPYGLSQVGVEWLRLVRESWNSAELSAWLARKGIAVLPGQPFYWDSPHRGDSYVRVALMRDTRYFQEAAAALAAWIDEY